MEMWMKAILNTKWKTYNDHFNEGEEGYNPHDKLIFIGVEKALIFNKSYTVAEARETLQKLIESLPKHTDNKKIQGCKDCIQILQNELVEVMP